MNGDDLNQALERLSAAVVVPGQLSELSASSSTKQALNDEKHFYAERHQREMAELDVGLEQRQLYAKRVFVLVCTWICAIFVLLLLQVFGTPHASWYRPLSDHVLITLITSTTVNLIGTLIIVLKYIFRVPRGMVTSGKSKRMQS